MAAGIIIFIVFIVILFLAGVGIGIYFLVRGSSGNTGSTGTNPNIPAFPNSQQGGKIVPSATSTANVGNSVAVSEDGNTMVVGAPGENGGEGGIWVYTRSEGVWSLQSSKLVGTGAVGNANQGSVVTIDADGNGIVVGGPADDSNKGAVWVYTRVNGAWSQVGSKITGAEAVAGSKFGSSVVVNDDDFTYLAVGGPNHNTNIGAVWIFTRSDTTWTQQTVLVPSDYTGVPFFGTALRLTDPGDALIAGGPGDNSDTGAFWIFVRSGSIWSQSGIKHVPTGFVGQPRIGFSVDISGTEGNTLVVGGPGDNSNVGAVWAYARVDDSVSQQGGKLVASNAIGQSFQGYSVRISDSGSTLLVGGPGDDSSQGAGFTWTRNDLLTWSQTGKIKGTGNVGAAQQGFSVALSLDGTTGVLGGKTDDSNKGAAWVFVYNI